METYTLNRKESSRIAFAWGSKVDFDGPDGGHILAASCSGSDHATQSTSSCAVAHGGGTNEGTARAGRSRQNHTPSSRRTIPFDRSETRIRQHADWLAAP